MSRFKFPVFWASARQGFGELSALADWGKDESSHPEHWRAPERAPFRATAIVMSSRKTAKPQ